jgi:chemotaxis signal transduction protein
MTMVAFWIGGVEFALPVAPVQEVLRVGAIAPVPRAAPRARGLTRVRGRLVPVIDPAVALGLPPSRVDDDARVVLVTRGPRLLGLLVERVDGLRVPREAGADDAAPDDRPPPPILDLDRVLEGA